MEKLIEYLLAKPDLISISSSFLILVVAVLSLHIMYRLIAFGVHPMSEMDNMYIEKMKYVPYFVLVFGFIVGFHSFMVDIQISLEETEMAFEKILPFFSSFSLVLILTYLGVIITLLVLLTKFARSKKKRKENLEGSSRVVSASIIILILSTRGFELYFGLLGKTDSTSWLVFAIWILITIVLLTKYTSNKSFTKEEFLFKKKSWIRKKLEEQKKEKAQEQETQ